MNFIALLPTLLSTLLPLSAELAKAAGLSTVSAVLGDTELPQLIPQLVSDAQVVYGRIVPLITRIKALTAAPVVAVAVTKAS